MLEHARGVLSPDLGTAEVQDQRGPDSSPQMKSGYLPSATSLLITVVTGDLGLTDQQNTPFLTHSLFVLQLFGPECWVSFLGLSRVTASEDQFWLGWSINMGNKQIQKKGLWNGCQRVQPLTKSGCLSHFDLQPEVGFFLPDL